MSLYPYVDESKLRFNMDECCGIVKMWEDEHLDLDQNNFKVSETGLITK